MTFAIVFDRGVPRMCTERKCYMFLRGWTFKNWHSNDDGALYRHAEGSIVIRTGKI